MTSNSTNDNKDNLNIHFNSDEMDELETLLFETPKITELTEVIQYEQIQLDKIFDEFNKINHVEVFNEIQQFIKFRWIQLKAMEYNLPTINPYYVLYEMYLNDLSYIYKCVIDN